ncbi:MAG: replication protein RepA [Gammaproteobacteria bacterium]|nr:replication protein RepA [Gammaproteobacteria bacterium]
MTVKRPPRGANGNGTLPPGRQRQLEELLAASDLDTADIGYLVRLLMLCTLPRTNPGKRLQYRRTNGPHELIMTATGRRGLPYGSLPRLMLAWVCTEALRTRSRELVLGRSLADFMRQLGITGRQGGPRGNVTRVRDQMHRLFYANVRLTHREGRRERSVSSQVTSRTDLWWDVRDPEAPMLFESTITLGAELYEEIIRHPVPLDMNVLKALTRSSLGLDLYMWLAYRTFTMREPMRLSWRQLYRQFGADPEKASDRYAVRDFRKDCLRELSKLKVAWPALQYDTPPGHLLIWPTESLVRPRRTLR